MLERVSDGCDRTGGKVRCRQELKRGPARVGRAGSEFVGDVAKRKEKRGMRTESVETSTDGGEEVMMDSLGV